LQHAIPGVVPGEGQFHVLAYAPLLEQHSGRVFTAKEGGDGLFERSAEELFSITRFFKFLPEEQRQAFLGELSEKVS
jgi:hypothetical protein